jgi:hypothetical protein
MSQIFRQGLNWVIIDHIGNLDFTDQVLSTVTSQDWSDFTSAKGPDSSQHYIINPSWMPVGNHQEPEGWETLQTRMSSIVQNQLVNYGLKPINWGELSACSAWTVIGEEGSLHTAHEHGPGNICSVTYIEVPEKSEDLQGQIYFILHSDPYSTISQPNFRVLHLRPQKGMIVIFPSWMIHGVYPQAAGTRQTLNIDFNGDPNFKGQLPQAGSARYG